MSNDTPQSPPEPLTEEATARSKAVSKALAYARERRDPPHDAPAPVAAPPAPQTLVDATTLQEVLHPALAALGACRAFNPPEPELLTAMILGFSGTGKTTFVSSIPNSLILSFCENAANSVIAPRAYHLGKGRYIKTWPQYVEVRDRILAMAKIPDRPINILVIDTGDEWFNIVADGVIAWWNKNFRTGRAPVESIGEVGQQGKGYALASEWMLNELRQFQAAGLGWVITGHLRERDIDVGSSGEEHVKTVIRPVLTGSAYKPIQRMSFLRGMIGVSTQTTETVLIPHPTRPGETIKATRPLAQPKRTYQLALITADMDDEVKMRLPGLPPVINLPQFDAWEVLCTEYNRAREAGRAQDAEIRAQRSREVQ